MMVAFVGPSVVDGVKRGRNVGAVGFTQRGGGERPVMYCEVSAESQTSSTGLRREWLHARTKTNTFGDSLIVSRFSETSFST